MKVLLQSIVVTILFSSASYSQNSAPVAWSRYKIAADGVSFNLPKMPSRQDSENPCDELRSSTFYAYAESVVYEVNVYEKKVGSKCYGMVTPFGARTVRKRLDELAKSETEVLGQKTKIEGREANRFATETSTRLVISEVNERKRWIELAVHHYSGDTLDVDRFLKSVEFSANSGIEIGDGVESVLGDPMPEVPATTKAFLNNGSSTAPAASVKSEPYRIISQPRAGYPDVTSCAQGAVRLKLTLLGSGAIGSIVVVTRLPDGLTESAIAAAKRIVFLPKRVNGIPVSSVITREYPFGIY